MAFKELLVADRGLARLCILIFDLDEQGPGLISNNNNNSNGGCQHKYSDSLGLLPASWLESSPYEKIRALAKRKGIIVSQREDTASGNYYVARPSDAFKKEVKESRQLRSLMNVCRKEINLLKIASPNQRLELMMRTQPDLRLYCQLLVYLTEKADKPVKFLDNRESRSPPGTHLPAIPHQTASMGKFKIDQGINVCFLTNALFNLDLVVVDDVEKVFPEDSKPIDLSDICSIYPRYLFITPSWRLMRWNYEYGQEYKKYLQELLSA